MNTATLEGAERAEIADAPPLGVLIYDDSIEGDWILAQAAEILVSSGLRLAGVVQSNIDRPGRRKCAMDLTDLTSGAVIAISQDLGEEARGCRLDTTALAQASLGVERALQGGVDLLIINKFGKQEALGQGFRPVIAEALMSDVPVVLGVSRLNLDACLDFAGGRSPVLRQTRPPSWLGAGRWFGTAFEALSGLLFVRNRDVRLWRRGRLVSPCCA